MPEWPERSTVHELLELGLLQLLLAVAIASSSTSLHTDFVDHRNFVR
jgi:hypothetical protein